MSDQMQETVPGRTRPDLPPNMWQLQLLGDLMFFASFFVLGGNFWEKIRALFIRGSRVAYPANLVF
ncbi:hypothetical protein D3C87_2117440 [compost metagenome]|jgi:hypothetical protein